MNFTTERAQAVLVQRHRELARLRTTNVLDEGEARASRSDERQSSDVLAQLSERERVELVEIDAALQRIREGNYGRCHSCGGPIGRHRLRAVPQAPLCMDCESLPALSPA